MLIYDCTISIIVIHLVVRLAFFMKVKFCLFFATTAHCHDRAAIKIHITHFTRIFKVISISVSSAMISTDLLLLEDSCNAFLPPMYLHHPVATHKCMYWIYFVDIISKKHCFRIIRIFEQPIESLVLLLCSWSFGELSYPSNMTTVVWLQAFIFTKLT